MCELRADPDRIAEARPLDADAWLRLAQRFVEDGRTTEALEAIARTEGLCRPSDRNLVGELSLLLDAVADHPEASTLELRMAKTCARTEHLERAILHAERGVASDIDNADAHLLLADLYWKKGRREEAIDALARVLWLRPNEVDAALLLAERLVDVGRFKSAHMIVDRIGDDVPPTAEGELRVGRLLRQCGLAEAALWRLEKAVALAGDSAHAHFELALAYVETGSPAVAIDELKEVVRLRDDWNEPLRRLAQVYRQLDMLAEAEQAEQQLNARPLLTLDVDIEMIEENDEDSEFVDASEITGKLRLIPVPELLQFLAQRKLTGVLRVSAAQTSGQIEIYEGSVVGAELAGTPSLQEILLKTGVITSDTLDASGLTQKELGAGAFCAALVEWDLADQNTLERTCFHHCQGILAELIGWSDGQIDFVSSETYDHEPKIRFDVPFLLLETMRKLDEEAR